MSEVATSTCCRYLAIQLAVFNPHEVHHHLAFLLLLGSHDNVAGNVFHEPLQKDVGLQQEFASWSPLPFFLQFPVRDTRVFHERDMCDVIIRYESCLNYFWLRRNYFLQVHLPPLPRVLLFPLSSNTCRTLLFKLTAAFHSSYFCFCTICELGPLFCVYY